MSLIQKSNQGTLMLFKLNNRIKNIRERLQLEVFAELNVVLVNVWDLIHFPQKNTGIYREVYTHSDYQSIYVVIKEKSNRMVELILQNAPKYCSNYRRGLLRGHMFFSDISLNGTAIEKDYPMDHESLRFYYT